MAGMAWYATAIQHASDKTDSKLTRTHQTDYNTSAASPLHNTAATALLLLTIPYSLLLLEPVTEQLENKAGELDLNSSESGVEKQRTTHWLVDRWATINLGRAVMTGVAAVAGTWAALGGVSVGGIRVVSGAGRVGL